MTLRCYQQRVVDEFLAGLSAGHIRQMVAMATGSGKTITAAEIIRGLAATGRRSLFIVDRIELIDQAASTLQKLGLAIGVLQGSRTCLHPDDEVIVASIQTIRARRAPVAEFIVIDEAHILHKAHIELMNAWNAIPVMGLSATPLREDLGKYFTRLIRGPSIRELIADGALVPARAYCPSHQTMDRILASVKTRGGDYIEGDLSRAINRKELVGDIVDTWQQKAPDRQTLCFAVDIAHSKAIIEDFINAGVKAAHLDAYTPPDRRGQIIDAFRAGDLQVLSSVNVLGIGFDAPEASCGILARPTLSEMLDMQQKGRVIRPAPGKTDALFLDHAGNTLKFGLPVDFEVPDLGAHTRKDTRQKRQQRKMLACTSCGMALEPAQITCPGCGIDRPDRSNKVHYLDARLVEFGSDDSGIPGYTRQDKQHWYLAFLWYARRKGRKDGWAYYAYLEKFGTKPAFDWRQLSAEVPTDEQQRWLKYYEIKRWKAWQKARAAS